MTSVSLAFVYKPHNQTHRPSPLPFRSFFPLIPLGFLIGATSCARFLSRFSPSQPCPSPKRTGSLSNSRSMPSPGVMSVVDFSLFSVSPVCAIETDTIVHAQDITIDNFDDPNFDPMAAEIEDESPYPEVRSAVSNTDDPAMPASTLRAWVVGLMWSILIPGINQFFFFRYPSVTIGAVRFLPRSTRFCPRTEPNPPRKDRPPAVNLPSLQSLGSLPAKCLHFWSAA
jgi:hypothetical protein